MDTHTTQEYNAMVRIIVELLSTHRRTGMFVDMKFLLFCGSCLTVKILFVKFLLCGDEFITDC